MIESQMSGQYMRKPSHFKVLDWETLVGCILLMVLCSPCYAWILGSFYLAFIYGWLPNEATVAVATLSGKQTPLAACTGDSVYAVVAPLREPVRVTFLDAAGQTVDQVEAPAWRRPGLLTRMRMLLYKFDILKPPERPVLLKRRKFPWLGETITKVQMGRMAPLTIGTISQATHGDLFLRHRFNLDLSHL